MNNMIKAAGKMIRDMMEYRAPAQESSYQATDQLMRAHTATW